MQDSNSKMSMPCAGSQRELIALALDPVTTYSPKRSALAILLPWCRFVVAKSHNTQAPANNALSWLSRQSHIRMTSSQVKTSEGRQFDPAREQFFFVSPRKFTRRDLASSLLLRNSIFLPTWNHSRGFNWSPFSANGQLEAENSIQRSVHGDMRPKWRGSVEVFQYILITSEQGENNRETNSIQRASTLLIFGLVAQLPYLGLP